MRKVVKGAGVLVSAGWIAATLGMEIAPARAARPEATDLFGYLYQLAARTFASLTMDRVALAAVFLVCLWLCRRYLFQRPAGTGFGEYFFSGFFGVMTVLCMAVREQETVAVLWTNLFQLAKAGMGMVGWSLLFLMLLRAMREGLDWLEKDKARERLQKFDDKNGFWTVFLVLTIAWLPHILIRYPGVLMWDSYMQIKQFMGQAERWANHPPFGTLLYGSVAMLGETIGHKNLVYFLFTLVQCAACIAILSYSLQVMKRLKAPIVFRLAMLALYALSPCYVGWQTVIAKDSSYVLLYLLFGTLMLEGLFDRKSFGPWKVVLFGASAALLALCRHNGAAAVAVGLLGMILFMGRKHWKAVLTFVLSGVLGLVIASGAEALIMHSLEIRERYIPDIMSYPFQQTARVVMLHQEEIPADEAEVIARVLDYENLAENYSADYADSVKDSYQQSATAQDRMAYWNVWLKQLMRYPVDYLEAALHMNGVLFDLQDNEPMYICFSDNSLYEDVYRWSFNDMTMYESEALIPLNSLNRTLTEWYMNFDKLPLIGWTAVMSVHSIGMLAILYISWTNGRRKSMLWWLPNLLSFGICLFAPVVYLRYALPYICAAPLGLAAYFAQNQNNPKQEETK